LEKYPSDTTQEQLLQKENEKLIKENEEFRILYRTIVEHATSLENELEEKLKEITHMSVVDYLTNIYNRRKFNECLSNEVEKARKTGSKLSLSIFDVDNFKQINDTFGHDFGDYVLVTTTTLIQGSLKGTDVFARWGGDEFVILLPDMTLENAAYLMDSVRKKVFNYYFEIHKCITCSFGVAEYSSKDDIKSFVVRADNALYEAKSNGRNCVRHIAAV
jgi:diguanylate cyclase (GGDEF)-like protein